MKRFFIKTSEYINIQISSYFDTSKDVLEENKELSKDNARSKDHIIRRYDMMEG